jgi:hypothetical protein
MAAGQHNEFYDFDFNFFYALFAFECLENGKTVNGGSSLFGGANFCG